VVFAASSTPTDPPQVWVSNVDGTGQKKLTTAASNEYPTGVNDDPSYSPDGETIVFASGRDFSSQGVPNPTLRLLYTMNADGSGQKPLTGNTAADCTERSPRYSPDGKRIVFSRVCASDPVSNDTDQLFVVNADGTNQERLVDGADASGANLEFGTFTPDGAAVLYVSDKDDPSGDLYAVDVATHQVTRLTQLSTGIVGAPMISPNGKTLYLVEGSFAATSYEVHALDASGGNDQKLFDIPADANGASAYVDLSLGPNGKNFAFAAFFDGTSSVRYRVSESDLDGSNVHAMTDAYFHASTPFLH
jgi:Tol biopolymer transport system component